jgi:hypothetical protein
MISLRDSLANIGKSTPFHLRGDLQLHPPSVREATRIMNLPWPPTPLWERRKVHDFPEENAQGVAYAEGEVWFLSSEWNLFRAIVTGPDPFRPTSISRTKKVGLRDLLQHTGRNTRDYDHISDIHWHRHLLFMIARCTRSTGAHLLLAVSDDLELVAFADVPAGLSDSWVAVDPWSGDGFIGSGAGQFYVFDLSEFYDALGRQAQWPHPVQLRAAQRALYNVFREDGRTPDTVTSVQGITFSQNGRLYVARFDERSGPGAGPWDNLLQVYETMTGRCLARHKVDFPQTYDEIEGLAMHPSGILYVAVAINDLLSSDQFQLHAFLNNDSSTPM